jgi:hypothetical protein
MVELRKYFDGLQDKLGETESADRIIEGRWLDVMKELNQKSLECAKELQLETRGIYRKDDTQGNLLYYLCYEEAPPTRLLALNLILSYWLGWISNEKKLDGDPVFAWDKIKGAYMAGRDLSERKEVR